MSFLRNCRNGGLRASWLPWPNLKCSPCEHWGTDASISQVAVTGAGARPGTQRDRSVECPAARRTDRAEPDDVLSPAADPAAGWLRDVRRQERAVPPDRLSAHV